MVNTINFKSKIINFHQLIKLYTLLININISIPKCKAHEYDI